MKRLLFALLLVAPLGGCITISDLSKSVFQGGTSITASVSNPVTPTMLYEAENALTVTVAGMLAYKKACAQKALPASCRDVVALLQTYTKRAKPLLIEVRGFIRNNDQVNAIAAFNEAQLLVSAFKQTAAVYQNGAL